MNVAVGTDGAITVTPPKFRPSAFIKLCAEMDLICGLTSCPEGHSINRRFKPIDHEILPQA